jgi:phosphoribosyl 1,2-cyclic phosphodiesterase
MKIRLWGTRGSIPSPGPSTVRYGGNTSCVEVRLEDDRLIILDAGSGIRPLGASLGPIQADLLLSHYHWDHIQGLPFFTPAFIPESGVCVVGPEFNGNGPDEYLSEQMYTPFFPASPAQLAGIQRFDLTPEKPFAIGDATIRAGRLSHPGVTYGYRIEEGGRTFVYMSDNEVDAAPPELFEEIVGLANGADLLLHDCQYTEPEYKAREGWGHSTPRQAAQVASAAGVKALLTFHHDPSHSDEEVEALADEACTLADGRFEVIIGREGDILVPGRPVGEAERAILRPRFGTDAR